VTQGDRPHVPHRTSAVHADRSWRGIFAIMVTPFADDHSLDLGGLRANAEFLAGSDVDVVVALGSEGEFYAMTDDERRRVVEVVAETVAGRKPVVAGVSHSSTIAAAALARHAAIAGCAAVLTTPPYYARPDDEGVIGHVARIAEADIPVILYNVPGRVGYNLSGDQIVAIAGRVPIAAVKQASPDISELADLVTRAPEHDFAVIGGAEVAIWPALAAGAAGNTATAASAIPSVFAILWRAAVAGDLDAGRDLYARLAPLRTAYRAHGGQVPVVKRLMELRGLAGGPPRPPLRRAAGELDADLMRLLGDLGIERVLA
jgi:4-hydroxy-tetrahydrodipicolinate synthase